jgi:hypothetical protein
MLRPAATTQSELKLFLPVLLLVSLRGVLQVICRKNV